MKGANIPGTFRLEHIRAVVLAVNDGVSTNALIGVKTGLGSRHVSFAVNAARIVGWLSGEPRNWKITNAGKSMLSTLPGSEAEAHSFHLGVSTSAEVKLLAPQLLEKDAPSFELLTEHITSETGVSEASAQRCARVLLSWRRQALSKGADAQFSTHQKETSAVRAHNKPQTNVPRALIKKPMNNKKGNSPSLTMIRTEGLGPFHRAHVDIGALTMLVGGAGAGKSSFVDVLNFISDAAHFGLDETVRRRGGFSSLLHQGHRSAAEHLGLVVELKLPPSLRPEASPKLTKTRYELVLAPDKNGTSRVEWEALFLKPSSGRTAHLRTDPSEKGFEKWRQIFTRSGNNRVQFRAERVSWKSSYQLDADRLALAEIPHDPSRFPAALATQRCIRREVKCLAIHISAIKHPCSPLRNATLAPDASNLAALAYDLERNRPNDFARWSQQVCAFFPWIKDVHVVEQSIDGHLFLAVTADGDHLLTADRLSDGIIRTLVLTLIPFINHNIIIIDDPSLGLSPRAADAVIRGWIDTGGDGQIIVTSTSPFWARSVPDSQLFLCSWGAKGSAEIVSAQKHSDMPAFLADL